MQWMYERNYCTILYLNPLKAAVHVQFLIKLGICSSMLNDSTLFDSIEIPSQVSSQIKWAKLSTFVKLNENDAIHWLLLFTNMGWPFILCFHFEIFENFQFQHKFINKMLRRNEIELLRSFIQLMMVRFGIFRIQQQQQKKRRNSWNKCIFMFTDTYTK